MKREVRCPVCGRSETGRVGGAEYYCWNCCVEFHASDAGWRLFRPDEEGALVELSTSDLDAAVVSS